MRITVICDVLGQENNGTTIAAMNLIRSMKARGHEVRVVCPDEYRRGQPGFYVVPTYNFGIFNHYVAKNGVVLAKPVEETIRAAMEGADVVHLLVPFGLSRKALRIARERHIPVTASFHCQAENITNHIFLMNAPLVNRLTYKVFYRLIYRWCDCIHYPTKFICDVFESTAGPTNHYIISNGVGKEFRPAPRDESLWPGKYVILMTGRYSREKSQHVLIDAIARSRHREQIQLVLAGSGPQRENLEARARKRGIPAPVFGFYSRQELLRIINRADLYVHTAQIEIEAIACLEAIACGKVPVIADSPRSATRNFALEENNLFRSGDPQDLADKIDYWLDHPEALARCGSAYLGYAQEFAFDRCMDRMEAMLADAAGMCHG